MNGQNRTGQRVTLMCSAGELVIEAPLARGVSFEQLSNILLALIKKFLLRGKLNARRRRSIDRSLAGART